ncbi:hypothetical protein KFE25_006123 [Diacronema lutheri]|uniref:Uncharacterized protein n=2 Tax=Diacronema lutheri TaxID=2081491 RepID=A0A8J5XKG8_DIALT|nr:hypothetical protein KFE25_006123 [Diacronema lutheri]
MAEAQSPAHTRGAPPWQLPLRVRVQNVVQRPEMNGQLGLALAWDAGTGRYAVRLDSCARVTLLPDRLEPLPGQEEVYKGVLSKNGLSFCEKHRVETCDECMLDFAVPNRMVARGHDALNPLSQHAYQQAERLVAQERSAGTPPLRAQTG